MKTTRHYYPILLLLASCISGTTKTHSVLEKVVRLDDYPSASGMEYINGQLYVIGDDARELLLLDTAFKNKGSVVFYASTGARIPKDIKPDNESIAEYGDQLFIFGSGSLSPYRNMFQVFDPVTRNHQADWIDILYKRFLDKGLPELNVEGAARIGEMFCLSTRGHQSYRKNHLLFFPAGFRGNADSAWIHFAELASEQDTLSFSGVSGMDYSPQNDQLLISVSTEDTHSSYEDGAIGKSYIWIVNAFSTKTKDKAIQPNRIIDLESIDTRFKGFKIESVCILGASANEYHLALAADNDDGTSTVFKLLLARE